MLLMPQAIRVLQFVWRHPANQRHRFRAMLKAVAWQTYKRITGRPWDFPVFNGMRLRCYPDSTSASTVIYCSDLPDYHEMNFMRDYLRSGDGFIDVGANVGVYTLLAVSVIGTRATIDIFEPDPKTLRRLRENITLNNLLHVHIHAEAVGEKKGNVDFVCDKDALNRIQLKNAVLDDKTTDVLCVRLDEILAGRRYAMGKMDIEGAEPLALKGAEKMLLVANPPVWLLELNGKLHDYGFTEEELAEWLRGCGYDLALYDADSHALTFPPSPWLTRCNVLAVARSERERVIERVKRR